MANKPLKILHIMPQIGIGGAETQLCHLIANSDPQQVCHEVLYYSDSNDEKGYVLYQSRNIVYSRVPRNKKKPVRFLRDFADQIRKRNPDVVQCWLWSGNLWGRWAAILAGVEHILVTYRSSKLVHPRIVRFLEFFTRKRVHHVANSKAVAYVVAKELGIDPAGFDVIYNGIDLWQFDTSQDRSDVLGELNVPRDAKIIAMVGRLTEAKNYPMLLRVARKCKEKGLHIRFVVVGHGPEEGNLKKLAHEMGLTGFVSFLGLRRDVSAILACSDIFCFTSSWEGFPNALLEAMASGLPVVTTDFDGVRELVAGPGLGTVVGRDDVDAAVEAIEEYLKDPCRAEKIGQHAKEFVQASFDMPVMVERTVELYKRLADG